MIKGKEKAKKKNDNKVSKLGAIYRGINFIINYQK